ncbi:MAG: hypothetical protein ABSD97_07765 [Acidimicrobiales bacterium]|jgi:hypothetical protein
MDRSAIKTAIRLLMKAESTDSEPESAALALRSYSLLADYINAYDLANAASPTGARRHERRRLFDRRSAPRSPARSSEPTANLDETTAADGYVRLGDGGARARRSVDFSL